MKFNKDLRIRLLLKSSMEDFKRILPCVDFKRSLQFRSFLQLQIYEGRLLKKFTLHKTSSEVFLCKYWLTFEIDFFFKFPEKSSRINMLPLNLTDVGHNFDFLLKTSSREVYIENTSKEVFSKSSGSLLNVARSLLGYFCN